MLNRTSSLKKNRSFNKPFGTRKMFTVPSQFHGSNNVWFFRQTRTAESLYFNSGTKKLPWILRIRSFLSKWSHSCSLTQLQTSCWTLKKERNFTVLRNQTTPLRHYYRKLASYPRGKKNCVTKFIQFPRNLETRLFVQEEIWDKVVAESKNPIWQDAARECSGITFKYR